MKTHRSAVLATAVTLLGALGAWGCGSSSNNNEDNAGGSASGAAAIKVGQMVAVGGPLPFDDLAAAGKAAVEGVNRRGGINGRRLEYHFCNEGNNPNQAVTCARKFVSDGVVAVFGSQSVTGEQQFSSVLRRAGIAGVGDLPTFTEFINSPTEFLLYQTWTGTSYIAGIKACVDRGLTRIATPAPAIPSAGPILDAMRKAATKLNAQIVSAPSVSLSQTDWLPVLQKIKDAGANCVDPVMPAAAQLAMMNARKDVGLADLPFTINQTGFSPKQLAALGATGNGSVVASAYPVPTATERFPVLERFQEDMKAFSDDGAPYDQEMTRPTAVNVWFAVQALAKVMADGHVPASRTAILAALRKAKDVDLGLPLAWSPNAPGPAGKARVWTAQSYLNLYRDGHLAPAAAPTDLGSLLR